MTFLKGAALSRQGVGLLAIGILASILLRVPYYQHSLIFVDEGIYATTASELVHGKVLYREIWCNHMPLAVHFCEWMFRLFGVNSVALHLGSLLLALLECLLLYFWGSRFFSPRAGGLAALAYAIVSANFHTPRIIGYTPEQLTVVCVTAAAIFFMRTLEGNRPAGLFWTGLLSAAAVFAKPSAAPEALMFAVFLLACGAYRNKAKALLWLACGAAAGLALFLGSLLGSSSLDAWWSQSVLTRLDYVNQVGLADWFRIMARQPLGFGLIYLWLWILIWSGRKGIMSGAMAGRFVWIWLAAAFIGVAMGRRFYANYYIQMFPVLSLMVAAAVDRMLEDGIRERHKTAARAAVVLLVMTFSYLQARTLAHWYFFMDKSAHERTTLWDMCVIDRDMKEIARQIRAATGPGDRIFVWGPNASFYFLSGRRPATAYPFFDVMDPAQPPYGEEEWKVLRELSDRPPALIVDHFKTVKMADRPGWGSLLARHYRLLAAGKEVRLYIRTGKSQSAERSTGSAGEAAPD